MRKLQFKQSYQHFLTTTDLQQMGNLTKVLNADNYASSSPSRLLAIIISWQITLTIS